MHAHIVAIIHGEPGAFGVSFPDLPGCIGHGVTLDQALANATDAVAFHVDGLIQSGETVPVPRALDALIADPEFVDDFEGHKVLGLVPLVVAGRAIRVNLTIEENLLAAIDRAAAATGATRSGFIAEAARAKIAGS